MIAWDGGICLRKRRNIFIPAYSFQRKHGAEGEDMLGIYMIEGKEICHGMM